MKKLIFILVIALSADAFSQSKKILIVSTNRDSVGVNRSGTFLKEIAYPFQHFVEKGFDVDILTPQGGKAAIYHSGTMPEALDNIQKSEFFNQKLAATLTPEQVNPENYAAVFYPGGHGQYFDVIHDERIATLTARIYESGGTIGTAGHGAASLIDVKLSNGKYLVQGKTITCFPHWAELAFMNISNYGKLLAFDMEEVLARRGANLIICTRETRANAALTLVADEGQRIVTGAFASSAQWVAEQMVAIINANRSSAPSDQGLILAAANKYINGRNNGDIQSLTSAFLSTATLTGVDPKSNEPAIISLSDYVKRNTAGKKHNCTTETRILDHAGNIAVVQITFRYATHAYYDYLTLLKVNSGWIIANKTYTQINP